MQQDQQTPSEPPRFSMGRRNPGHRQRRSTTSQKKIKKVKPSNGTPFWPAFPILNTKYYDLQLNFMLAGFPRSSVQAVRHYHKLIAPGTTPYFFALKPEEVQKLTVAFYENIRARWALRKLLILWRYRRCKSKNDEDPMTLEPIKDEIRIYDLFNKAFYRFEAKSLARVWKSNLLHHDGVFPDPRMPINPLTNLSLPLIQLHSSFKVLRSKGHIDWILDSFQGCSYDLEHWQKKFGVPLKIESLNRIFEDKNSYDRFDMIMDFAEVQFDLLGVDFPKKMFTWIFNNEDLHEYAKLWIRACKKFYLEKYTLIEQEEIDDLEARSSVAVSNLVEIPEIIKLLYDKHLERIFQNGRRRLQNAVLQGQGNSIVSANR